MKIVDNHIAGSLNHHSRYGRIRQVSDDLQGVNLKTAVDYLEPQYGIVDFTIAEDQVC
jgi:hypothetical protein